jgi:hypothetical protein
MTNTYTRWIRHGEALEVRLNENFETGDICYCVKTRDICCNNVGTEMNEPKNDPEFIWMAPRSEAFPMSEFIWIDLSLALDDARNGLPYAPYIF